MARSHPRNRPVTFRQDKIDAYWRDFLRRCEETPPEYKHFEREYHRGPRKNKKAHIQRKQTDKEMLGCQKRIRTANAMYAPTKKYVDI